MEELQVRGHIGKWVVVLRVVSIIGVLAGIVLIVAIQDVWGEILFGTFLVTCLLLESFLVVRRRQRVWVTDLGNGLAIRDASGKRQYTDEDVYSLDFHAANEYSQGEFKGVRRRLVAKIEGEDRPLEINNLIKPDETDPLQPLITRLIDQYRNGVNEALRAGAAMSGKDWTLTEGTLTIQGRDARSIPLSDISSVTEMDKHVCVWKRGDSTATLRVPVGSPNAFLLQLILEDRVQQREDDASADTEGLGRVLFERRTSGRLILWIIAVVLFPVAAILTIAGAVDADVAMIAAGVGIFVLVGFLLWSARRLSQMIFRAHERGVYRRGFNSMGELYYDDVSEFSYSATRQYYNGVYIGTSLSMTLTPAKGSDKQPIRFSTSVKNADEALDQLRDHISMVLAVKMLQQLGDGTPINWTPNLTLTADGIEYRPAGFVRRKEASMLPYENVHAFDIQQGTFYLWEKGKDKPVMQESSTLPNFFPGYLALCQIFSPPAEQEAEA